MRQFDGFGRKEKIFGRGKKTITQSPIHFAVRFLKI